MNELSSNPQQNPLAKLSYFDFNGIQVPFKPTEQFTVITAEGEVVRDVKPVYVNNLETYARTGSMQALGNAFLSMTKEAELDMLKGLSIRHHGYEAPLALSNAVPVDHVYIDLAGGRIILNETQALFRFTDADGDRGTVIFNAEKTQCVLIKFPLTMQPLILTVMKDKPREKFISFSRQKATSILKAHPIREMSTEEMDELFLRKHRDTPVGLLTSMHNCKELFDLRGEPWERKNELLFNTNLDPISGYTQRAKDIELGGMKVNTKGGQVSTAPKRLGASKALDHMYAWALTACSGIGTARPDQLAWFDGADLDKVCEDITKLNLKFRDATPAELKEPKTPWIENGLLRRLKNLGLVDWHNIQHADPTMPTGVASCMFWLRLPNGEPVALTDVKRSDGREEGLTYSFMMAPVFDCRDIMDADGNVILPATYTWLHPIDMMQKVLSTFDSTVRPSSDGPISHYFPRDIDEWVNPKRSAKISMLQQVITEYCGKYGDPCPATKKGIIVVPSEQAVAVITKSVVIDYGRNRDEFQMLEIALKANKDGNICIVGSKGTSRSIRKYVLSNGHGGSCFDSKNRASKHRGAAGRSQLMRCLGKQSYMVAIVATEIGHTQVHITPTGVEKQSADNAFLPQIFTTKEAYAAFLTNNHLTEEEYPVSEVTFKTWTGEKRKCWTHEARGCIRVGKLVDTIGNKFMPRTIGQAYAKEKGLRDTIPVDLIFPITELVEKEAHHIFLQDAVESTLYLEDGTEIKCMLVKRTFFRTGAASENIPPRRRVVTFKGIDSYPIAHRLFMIGVNSPRKVDTSFAKLIQRTKEEIKKSLGIATSTTRAKALPANVKIPKLPS